MKYCDGDLPKYRPFKESLPEAVSEMDTLSNNGTKLDQRNIIILLSYLLNAIGNENAILDAYYDLVGLLVMLFSRSYYVTHFRHKKGVNYVWEEVQYILSV